MQRERFCRLHWPDDSVTQDFDFCEMLRPCNSWIIVTRKSPEDWLSCPEDWLSSPEDWLSIPEDWLSSPEDWLSSPEDWLSNPEDWL